MNEKPLIFNVQKFSVHDGPGIRTTVFFKGCPLGCLWCSNPESQSPMPELQFFPDKCIGCGKCMDVCEYGAITPDGFDRSLCQDCMACTAVCKSGARKCAGEEKTVLEIIEATEKDITFYQNSGGGITFSGGEPMLYPRFIQEVASHYKDTDVTIAVETCGQAPWVNFEKVLPFVDILLYDIKTMDSNLHKRYCCMGNEQILGNLSRAAQEDVEIIVRMPVLPGINDNEVNLKRTADFMLKHGLKNIHLLPYHSLALFKYDSLGMPYMLKDMQAPSDEKMQEIKKTLEGFGLTAQIGG